MARICSSCALSISFENTLRSALVDRSVPSAAHARAHAGARSKMLQKVFDTVGVIKAILA